MLLERTTFFIRERVSLMKLKDTFDILDPETEQPIGIAREEPPGWVVPLRLLVNKRILPTVVNVYENEASPPVLSIRRPFTLLRANVVVLDRYGQKIGSLKSKPSPSAAASGSTTRGTSRWPRSKGTGRAGTSASSAPATASSGW